MFPSRLGLAVLSILLGLSTSCGDSSAAGPPPPPPLTDAGIDAPRDEADAAPEDVADVAVDIPLDSALDAAEEVAVDAEPDAEDHRPVLARCTSSAFNVPAAQGFDHEASDRTAALGGPMHSLQDAIVADDAPWIAMTGRFAYGLVFKALEDEQVDIYIDRCHGYEAIGHEITGHDGRALVTFETPPPGIYAIRMVALGDGSVARGTVFVLPRGSHFVVFDIDGTLTTDDKELFTDIVAELFAPMLEDGYLPTAYEGGQALTGAHVTRGELILYLTGRPYWLAELSRGWLDDSGFPLGAVHTTDDNLQVVPSDSHVGQYKLEFLADLIGRGFEVDFAYGNATTDIYGYLGAGLVPEDVWIIGDHGGESGTNGVTDSWVARAAEVQAMEAVTQPFR